MPSYDYLNSEGLTLLWSRIRERTTALQSDIDDTNDRIDDLNDAKLNSVIFDNVNYKLVQVANGVSTDIVTSSVLKSSLGLTKADVGLGSLDEDAQENVIEIVKVNGTALTVDTVDKSVNVVLPNNENVIEIVRLNGTALPVDSTDKSVNVTFTSQENVIEIVKLNGTELSVDSTDKSVDIEIAVPDPTDSVASPVMNGVASAGSAVFFSKEDHVHPSDTSRAPVDHASASNTYGVGSSSLYGHVLLSDAIDSSSAAANGGIAATPKAVLDSLNAAKNYADEIAEAASIGEPNVIEEIYVNGIEVEPDHKKVYLNFSSHLIDGNNEGSFRSSLAISENIEYAIGEGSSAIGIGTIASGANQLIIGKYNAPSGSYVTNTDLDHRFCYLGPYNVGESVTIDIGSYITSFEKSNIVSIEFGTGEGSSDREYDDDTENILGDCAYILNGDDLTIVYPDSETPVPADDESGEAAVEEEESYYPTFDYDYAYIWITVRTRTFIDDDSLAFVVGNGESDSDRSNAFTVAWDGRITAGASQDYSLVMGGSDNYAWIDCRDSSNVMQNNLVLYANGITKVRNLNATGIIHTPNPIRIEHDGVSKGDTPSSENWKAIQFLNDGATALSTAGHAQRTGTFLNTILTSGNIVTQMTAYKPEANATDYAQISVWYPISGSPYIQLGAETRVSGVLHVNSGKALAIHNTDVTKGSSPSSQQYAQLHFMDNTANTTAETANRLASVRQYTTTAGTNVLQMAAYKNDASVASSVSVGIYYPLTGTTYIQLGARTRVTNGIDVTSGKYINIHSSDLAKGSTPASTQYAQIYFGDSEVTTNADANTFALLRSYVDTNGTSCCGIYALKNEASSTSSAYIRATYPLSGDPYVYANCLIRSAQEVGTGGKSAWNDTTNSGIWMTGASGQIHISSNTADSGGIIGFHFNKSASSTSSITEPVSGTLRISGPLRINGHSENIGYLKADTKNDISLAAGGTGKTVTTLSLNIGRWVVIGKLTFPNASSATYIRGFIGTTNNSASADDERPSLNGYQTVMTISKVLDVTADNTTYYLCASASVARTVSGTFQAIRIQ